MGFWEMRKSLITMKRAGWIGREAFVLVWGLCADFERGSNEHSV